jgi:hypothetical protein
VILGALRKTLPPAVVGTWGGVGIRHWIERQVKLPGRPRSLRFPVKGDTANAAEAEFLASLTASTGSPRHQSEVDAYVGVCKQRATTDNAGFTTDIVRYASHLRRVARLLKVRIRVEEDELGIIDFDETLPDDSLSSRPLTDPKFDVATCTLKD